ncbi:MAG: hypothetical protein ACM3MB_11850 [Acidobacteriota bacterium]
MPHLIKELISIATRRGNKLKGETTAVALQSKVAELGVLLLEKAGRFPDLEDSKIRAELIEIQNKLYNLRKVIFASKVHLR